MRSKYTQIYRYRYIQKMLPYGYIYRYRYRYTGICYTTDIWIEGKWLQKNSSDWCVYVRLGRHTVNIYKRVTHFNRLQIHKYIYVFTKGQH